MNSLSGDSCILASCPAKKYLAGGECIWASGSYAFKNDSSGSTRKEKGCWRCADSKDYASKLNYNFPTDWFSYTSW